jgi:hypothetical protein
LNDKHCPLTIEHLAPYFFWQFGISIPENLKPPATSLSQTELTSEDLVDFGAWMERQEEQRQQLEDQERLFSKGSFLCQSRRCHWEQCALRSDGLQLIESIRSRPDDRQLQLELSEASRQVQWLCNEKGKEEAYRSISPENFQELEEGVYQIGMQSTSSKEYFRYTSTSANRKVYLRMVLFHQYHPIQNKGAKEEYADFLIRLNQFEQALEGLPEPVHLLLYFDAFKGSYLEIQKEETVLIREENFGWDIDFNHLIHKIETR